MSFSQSLTISQNECDTFAPMLQAGMSGSKTLAKSIRNYDIESVNIVKTCEKLCLVIKDNSKSNYEFSQGAGDIDKECAVRKSYIPFRAFTNIWIGTLKIYQQQVNTLFHLSQDLLSRSCNYDIKNLKATKRKSSTSHKIIKKRRLTLSESTNKKSSFSTNYSELLDDLEKLTQESIEKSLNESFLPITHPVTQLQVREITIREITATNFHSPDVLDEDSGFGEATREEIAKFLNFAEDDLSFAIKKTPIKRKSCCEQETPSKQCRFTDDYCLEQKHNENITDNSLEPVSFERSITPTIVDNKFMENMNTRDNVVLTQNLVENNDFLEDVKLKMESEIFINETEYKKNVNKFGMEKKKRLLIIDECTKMDTSELMKEIKNTKMSAKLVRKCILKSYKTKKIITALDLLTQFNRRSFKLSLTLKKKVYISQQQFEHEYLSLLREIFKKSYNETWASEIYPKWKYFKNATKRSNKIKQINKQTQPEAISNNLQDYLITDVWNYNDNNNYNGNDEINFNKESFGVCNHSDWRPFGVMLHLLNLWRLNQTNEIAATKLFKLAKNRIDRALGFYSLLNLSKKHFVSLTKFPQSIALQSILMGKIIKNSNSGNTI